MTTAQSEMRCETKCVYCYGTGEMAVTDGCGIAQCVPCQGTGRQPAADEPYCACGIGVPSGPAHFEYCMRYAAPAALGEPLTCCGKAHAYDAARAEIADLKRVQRNLHATIDENCLEISTQAQEIARLMAAPLVKYGQNSVQFYEAPPVDKALAECNATISARDTRVRELEATLLRLRGVLDPHHPTAVGWIDAALDSRQKGEL